MVAYNIHFGSGITIGAGITAGASGGGSGMAPVASDFTLSVQGDKTLFSVGLSSYITGTYNSVNIISVTGSGGAIVSGTDILVTSSQNSYPNPPNQTIITYTVSNGSGTSNQGVITFNDSCCVVATELTSQGLWSTREYAAINMWGAKRLDKTFIGRALHKGYHIIAPKVVVPALKQKGTIKAEYFKWSFDNATNMLRGKKYDKLSVVNSALWITAMTITGLFATQKQAEKSWKSSYKDKK